MRPRTTLILLLVLLGLGAYVYWIEVPKAEQEAKKKTLFEFKADDATEVALVYQDREIALKKSGANWRLTKPIDAAADEVAAKNLVNAISDCEIKKELTEASSDLAQYGLDKPFVTVTLKLKDKELPAVAIGKNTPIGFATYIQRADDKKVLLGNAAFRSGMDKQVKDLRDKTILDFSDADVQKFELQAPGKDIRLTRKDETWTIEQPGPYAADPTTVRSFLSTLHSMRAVDFADDNPTNLDPYGLGTPKLKVTLYLGKDNAEKRIVIGAETPAKKDELYLQGSGVPTVFTISDYILRDLNKDVGELRDKTLVAFDRANLKAVEVHRSDATQFKLVGNDKDGWHIDGQDGKTNTNTITQYIGDLKDLKGFEVAADGTNDMAPFGLDHPLLSVTLVGDESKPIGTILIGEHKNDQGAKEYFATAANGPTVFKIRDYVVTRLNKQAHDFIEVPTPTPGVGTPTAGPEPAEVEADDEPMGEEADE